MNLADNSTHPKVWKPLSSSQLLPLPLPNALLTPSICAGHASLLFFKLGMVCVCAHAGVKARGQHRFLLNHSPPYWDWICLTRSGAHHCSGKVSWPTSPNSLSPLSQPSLALELWTHIYGVLKVWTQVFMLAEQYSWPPTYIPRLQIQHPEWPQGGSSILHSFLSWDVLADTAFPPLVHSTLLP